MKQLSVAGVVVVAAGLLFAARAYNASADDAVATAPPMPAQTLANDAGDNADDDMATEAKLVLAGGCFWCVEAVFEPLDGVTNVVSGYAGGSEEDADYKKVSMGQTEHIEAVEITYNPQQISYAKLLQVFFATHNPTEGNGQKPDYGEQYRPVVWYANDAEKQVVEAYIAQLNDAGIYDKPIATEVTASQPFYPAEDYHQDYVKNNPNEPYVVQWSRPKVAKVKKLFPELLDGDMTNNEGVAKIEKSEAEWKEQLTDEQFYVLREEGTERPNSSPLNKVKEPGTFVCAGCELPLFETKTKFESGTGWPSFYAPISAANVTEKQDNSLGMSRVEIECARCGGHIGHVFTDGPEPTGLRYCMNGVAMEFKPENAGE